MSVPVSIDYFAAADANTLLPAAQLGDGVVILAAIRLPSARLIDNLVLTKSPSAATRTTGEPETSLVSSLMPGGEG